MATKKAAKKPKRTVKRAVKKKVNKKATRKPYRTLGSDLGNAIIRLQNDLEAVSKRLAEVEDKAVFIFPCDPDGWPEGEEVVDVIPCEGIPPHEGEGQVSPAPAGDDEQVGESVL